MDKSRLKISVIIPVYNTEAYVEEAVRSILNQTLQEIEVIVVNDGSTDGSLSVVERLSREDERMIVLSQHNQGQSVARNRGLERAEGEYVYFMDSDDRLRDDALERCYEKCSGEGLDFLFFDAMIFGDENRIFPNDEYIHTKGLEDRIYCGCEILNLQLDRHKFRVSMCVSLVSRDYLNRISLRLFEGIIHEDEIFTTMLYVQATKVGFISETFFCRRLRPNSTMTNVITKRNVIGYLTAARVLTEFAKESQQEVMATVNRYVEMMLNAAVRKFYPLPLGQKMRIAATYLFHYTTYFKLKTFLILFLK